MCNVHRQQGHPELVPHAYCKERRPHREQLRCHSHLAGSKRWLINKTRYRMLVGRRFHAPLIIGDDYVEHTAVCLCNLLASLASKSASRLLKYLDSSACSRSAQERPMLPPEILEAARNGADRESGPTAPIRPAARKDCIVQQHSQQHLLELLEQMAMNTFSAQEVTYDRRIV